jgi:hypothetical protein
MFRGIDPQGLDDLAKTLDMQTRTMRHQTRIALDLLHRNEKNADASGVGSAVGHIENWSLDTTSTLQWRAEAIRSGQDAGLDIFRLARARFAAEAVFSIDTVGETYGQRVERLQASERQVEEATTDISDWLSQGWTDWDVTNDDLHNIWRTLEGLSGEELDDVIAALSPRQLERWIKEMGNAINGLSREEKRQVFSMLAANSSSESLGKIHDAILTGGSSEEASDFGGEIGRLAPDQVIVSFVIYAINQGLANREYSGVAPALAADGIENSAAIDEILHAVVASLGALPLIVVDSLVVGDAAGPNPLDSLVSAITRGDDPRLKAAAFTAIAAMATGTDARLRDLLRTRHHIYAGATADILGTRDNYNPGIETLHAAEPVLLENATTILVSDANDVVAQLATRLDPTGSLTTDYLYTLVDRDEIGQLGLLVDRLRGGDIVDAVAFSQAGTNPNYRYSHAQNLGFVAGNLRKALERYVEDAQNHIQWITWGAKIATVAIGAGFTRSLGGLELAGTGLEGAAEWVSTDYWASHTQSKMDDDLERLLDTTVTNLQPPLSLESGPPHLGDALQWWHERYDIVRGA